MTGGLDLLTPAIQLSPGKCFDGQNYEPQISGGYRRIDGFERFDGRTSPSTAIYWVMTVLTTGALTTGASLTGLSSGATARILGLYGTVLVLGRVVGTFTVGEALQIAAVTVATASTTANQGGAATPSADADYTLLAANDYRADIGVVPGSGRIRGVWVFNDVVYAFRDNAGATAGALYKHTAGGWVQVSLGNEIQFAGAVGQISAGQTITGLTSGATALVTVALLRTGSWTSAGVGTLIISTITGTFQNGEALRVAGVTKATANGINTAITRAPGGRMVFVNANFTGSTATKKMYGTDGVNLAFEFDGTTYIPIRTGMTTDTPVHVVEWQNYLWLSYLGSVQYSVLASPYSWTVVLGAGEIAVGDPVTGMIPQGGTSSASSMAIFTSGRTYVLYGTSPADFKLSRSAYDLGFMAYTAQPVGNNTFGLTSRGVQSLLTTLNYGDFEYASITHLIQTLIVAKRGLEIASNSSQTKNQYRVYFNDGTGIVISLTGDQVNGMMPLNYGIPVRCIVTATLTSGEEVTYFGSDSGYVYRDSIGTSFDGATIEAYIRPAFNNLKSPRLRKRFRRAIFEIKADGFSQVKVAYDLGYGNPAVNPSGTIPDTSFSGGGSYWDSFYWESFNWDNQIFADPSISIEGTEKNISFFFYSNRAQDKSHTVQGVTLLYSPRRTER